MNEFEHPTERPPDIPIPDLDDTGTKKQCESLPEDDYELEARRNGSNWGEYGERFRPIAP